MELMIKPAIHVSEAEAANDFPSLLARVRAGAEGQPRYASTETSVIALGCLAPDQPDDLHVFHDLHALIHAGTDAPGTRLPAQALLVSSLRATAPLMLLNVSLGDQALVVTRRCGCPLEGLGWTTHLHTIRSFEKLTAGGMQFLDADVVRVLEDVLPSRFGGAPTDYQLVEEGTDADRYCLRLLVRPEVGPLDPDAVAQTFLAAIGAGFGPEKVMGLLWREAKLLEVERRAPLATASGKILHLHVAPGHADP